MNKGDLHRNAPDRRLLAIGDIHGCSIAFDALLGAIALQPNDLLVTLGDYVDRGPDSKGILERLITLDRRGQLVALRGNHELMMLAARERRSRHDEVLWLNVGGAETLDSYTSPGWSPHLSLIPPEHWDFIENTCTDWWETETHFFVHANAEPERPLAEQSKHTLFWERFYDCAPHDSGKIMVCGHTSQKNGKPADLGHAICIDTWAYGEGWLTCLDIARNWIWQANQRGEVRSGWLDE